MIFANDHEPAHAHVFGDGQAKVNLVGRDGQPELVWADEMKQGDVRRVMRLVTEQKDYLLKRWNEIHG